MRWICICIVLKDYEDLFSKNPISTVHFNTCSLWFRTYISCRGSHYILIWRCLFVFNTGRHPFLYLKHRSNVKTTLNFNFPLSVSIATYIHRHFTYNWLSYFRLDVIQYEGNVNCSA